MSKINLYRHPLSGHSHRVELMLSLLNIDANIIDIDLMNGEQKSPEFLHKNPAGQVPVLGDGDEIYTDSNAILVYLANKYDAGQTWMPVQAEDAAAVQRFLSAAAGAIATGPAAARLVTLFGADLDHAHAVEAAHTFFSQLESHLSNREWLATDGPTIADIANYAYIAHAPEGNVDLSNYPSIKRWLARIERLPGFVPMKKSTVGLAA